MEPPVKPNQTQLKLGEALSLIPENSSLDIPENITLEEMKDTFLKYINTVTYECQNDTRFGRKGDGGWNVCMDVGIIPGNCIIYSFG